MDGEMKAPYPWFGGKSRVAPLVWKHLGGVQNYIEPFFGSGAVLLGRPTPFAGVETVNDLDCYLSNFWRAIQADPDAVAAYADWPVSEADLHARHRYLVLSEDAGAFRSAVMADPHHYDPKFAGWWVWGLCCWIGNGWCSTPQPAEQLPMLGGDSGASGCGVHRKGKEPRRKIVNSIPHGVVREGRPQLADARDIGRGVHSNGDLGTCRGRRQWLTDWFRRLADRLRLVRVCCGDWRRVCSSPSVTTRLGLTGVFFDPPYAYSSGRAKKLYAQDSATVADDVRAWCHERGPDPQMRIVLAGYEGEHESLEAAGWRVVAWRAQGGYGNRTEQGRENAGRERLWFSPHCVFERGLFDGLEGHDYARP